MNRQTIEQKAQEINLAWAKESWDGGIELIAQALRDQIEECAIAAKKAVDERSFGSNVRIGSLIADEIRALAAQKESEETK